MEFFYHPINPFQNDGLSKEDRAMIDGMREIAYICGKRGGDVEHAVHQTLKKMGRYDLLPPCERESEGQGMTNEELKSLCYKIIDLIDYAEHIGELHNCNTCVAQKNCIKAPRPGEWTRINCFAWEGAEE